MTPLFFDDFELRPDSGELLKAGSPVKLQPQPGRVLEILAGRSGQVVEREELRQLVWGDAFLDFDASLNFCVKQIRQALGDSATEPRFVETIPRRGYRFLMPVRTGPEPVPSPPEPKKVAKLAALSVALLAGALILLAGNRQAGSSTPRLAVLPLECRSTDPAGRQICAGITKVLTAEMARQFPKDLQVVAADSVRVFAEKSSPELSRRLNATHLLSGEVAISGQELEMSMRLAPAFGGEALWRGSFRKGLKDAPVLYAQIAQAVAQKLGLPPPVSDPRPAAKPSSEGYEAYLQGKYLLDNEDPVAATASLQNAVLLDPTFAPAFAALALAMDGTEQCPNMAVKDATARRALELDPNLAEAHFALAQNLFHCYLDWPQAGQEFERALALDPRNAGMRHQYAFYLAGLGRHDEAIASVSLAREIDPANMLVSSDLAYFLYLGRHYDEAIRQAWRALDLIKISPESPRVRTFYRYWSFWVLLRSALELKDEATAVEAGKGLMDIYGDGEKAAQVRTLADFRKWHEPWLRERARTRGVPAYFFATANTGYGHPDEALAAMEEDCRTRRSFMMHFVAVEPALDPLHGDPRFGRVVDCMGVPADAPARRAMRASADDRQQR